jgi:hypothetical protein
MTMTDEFLDRLSRDLRPVSKGVVVRRLAASLIVGGAVAFIGVAGLLGLRADMPRAVLSGMFWIKLAYTGGIAAAAFAGVERLSRPAGDAGRRLAWLAAPLAAMGAVAGWQFWSAPPPVRETLIMGSSAAVCPWLIFITAIPLFAALVWALRGLAPTRPRAAGALAGLTAGGAGAAVYALHCPESGAPFVAIWYSLGILLACGLGGLTGPRLLRW